VAATASPAALAAALPDAPRWVEIRGMLLSGRGVAVGAASRAPLAFVAVQADTGLVGVAGRPPRASLKEALALPERVRTVLAFDDNHDWVRHALPGWRVERATIHVPGERAVTAEVPSGARRADAWGPRLGDRASGEEPSGGIRLVGEEEIAALESLPAELRRELLAEARAGTEIAARMVDGRPVAFCYAGAATERWWDVSIDTLEGHRRRGYARECVAHQIARQRRRGREPVWGAIDSNEASRRLAASMGFIPVDALFVFEPPR
jgi:GNAT superfamily N-acetyltransferase